MCSWMGMSRVMRKSMLRTPGPGWLLRAICGGRPVVGAPDEELMVPPKILPSAAVAPTGGDGTLRMVHLLDTVPLMPATMGKPPDSVAVPENVKPSRPSRTRRLLGSRLGL